MRLVDRNQRRSAVWIHTPHSYGLIEWLDVSGKYHLG